MSTIPEIDFKMIKLMEFLKYLSEDLIFFIPYIFVDFQILGFIYFELLIISKNIYIYLYIC